jgi:IS5 family transposase
MKKEAKSQRNWREYNKKLQRSASLELYINEAVLEGWHYVGERKAGGIQRYPDTVIEAILCVRELFGLALRQTQGFVESLLKHWLQEKTVPHYSTLCRRMQRLQVKVSTKLQGLQGVIQEGAPQGLVLAIDSTGLSIFKQDSWNTHKHRTTPRTKTETWRKLHVCIDTQTGDILSATYSKANSNDPEHLPTLLADIPEALPIQAVCADKAYDTVNCRLALQQRKAQERIDIRRDAKPTSQTTYRYKPRQAQAFQNRDWQLQYIAHNAINGDTSMARKTLKRHIGYHRRSRVETTMWQIKAHTGMYLTNKLESSRQNQALLKCKLTNIINAL